MAKKTGIELLEGRPATLDRWPGVRLLVHRALLLHAMQSPDMRSGRATSKAIGRVESTIREWRRKYAWDARIAASPDHDRVALDMYRHTYMKEYGAIELPFVAERMRQAFGGEVHGGTEAARALQESAEARRNALPKALRVVESAVAGEMAKFKAEERTSAKRHLLLVDASLGLIAQRLKGKDIKVSLRDIPVLLECRQRLAHTIQGVQDGGHGAVVESSRVKHAKATGGDVVDAMYDDAEELVAILGVLRTRRDTDTTQLGKEQAEA